MFIIFFNLWKLSYMTDMLQETLATIRITIATLSRVSEFVLLFKKRFFLNQFCLIIIFVLDKFIMTVLTMFTKHCQFIIPLSVL